MTVTGSLCGSIAMIVFRLLGVNVWVAIASGLMIAFTVAFMLREDDGE